MKKKLLAIFLACALLGGSFSALAAGGSADDPLLSLSYLKNTLKPQITASIQRVLSPSFDGGRESALQITKEEARYKSGDILSAKTGAEIMVLAGEVKASIVSGTVIDATAGTELSNGALLPLNSRIIAGESTDVNYYVSTPTAVISITGTAEVIESAAPDYESMADALYNLNLFQGNGTGFGSGYALERKPTRIEALVMFIRLLGEEQPALASTSKHPFTDVPKWADRYVAYAYEQGYTNGMSQTKFGSSRDVRAREYVEFLMRALKYSSIDHSDLSSTLPDAHRIGLLTDGELQQLTSEPLYRAHVVYVSYYALAMPIAQQDTILAMDLISKNVFSAADYEAARKIVSSSRL